MILEPASIGSVFERAIVDTGRLPAFLFFVALLGTFAFIRTSTHMIHAQVSWWPGNVSVGGTHVHHLVWGLCAMMFFGYIGVVVQPDSPWQELVSVFFAIGMGLTLDEFALWLELKDVYWETDGRKSVDAMIVAGCFTGIALVGFSAWVEVAEDVENLAFAAVGLFGLAAIAIAAVNLAKEKFVFAVVGLLIWPLAIVPAFRIAKPGSFWARRFYRGARLEQSKQRYPAGAGGGSAEPPPAPPSPAASSTEPSSRRP